MKKYLFLAAAAIAFAACTNESDPELENTQSERIPLAIGTSYCVSPSTVTTRSTRQTVQNDTISKYSDIGLFVLKDGSTTEQSQDYDFFNIQASATTDITNSRSDLASSSVANVLVYPSDKSQGINLYAYAPYNSGATITDIDASTTSSNVISVSVLADQSTDLNYIKSDIIWGCVGENAKGKSIETAANAGDGIYPYNFSGKPGATINGTKYVAAKTAATDGYVSNISSPKVIIPMLHRAAKVVVKLKVSGMPLSKLLGAKVTIHTFGLTSNLRIDNGVLAKVSGGSGDILMTNLLGYKHDPSTGAYTALATSDANTNGDNGVINNSGGSDMETYLCSAVVMPQDLTTSTALFTIQLADGASSNPPTAPVYSTTYKYTTPSSLSGITSFESGKVYTYTITVKASGLSVTSTIADWVTGSTDSGDAVLQ